LRRSRGEGSIYKRKDGSWVAQYRDGSKKRYLYGKNRKAVADRLREVQKTLSAGGPVEESPVPFGEYLGDWLKATEGSVRKRTFDRYECLVRIHVVPEIGDMRLKDLRPRDLQDLYQKKIREGLSARTVQYVHVTVARALKRAVGWGMLARSVADAVTPPRPQKKEIRGLSPEEVERLLVAARGRRFWEVYLLAVTTGARAGELLGLQWPDIDWGGPSVRIRRTIYEGRVSAPKTARGTRSISLTGAALAALSARREREEGPKWVFSTSKGTAVQHSNLVRSSFKPLLREAGLPDIPFHSLRHTCATLLLAKNVNPKIVSEMLGHASISIPLDTYSHVLPTMQTGAVAAMEDVLKI